MLDGGLEIGNYHKFVIYEPKKRQICAAPLRQRILHHAIMNVCHEYFERHLIFDCYASRPGKGTHKAIKRVQDMMGAYRYFAKIDIRKYFDSIDHDVLKALLVRLFNDQRLLCLFDKIIDSYGERTGLPIGNLTSQYFANYYLSSLDHYMKEVMGAGLYVRYMDDVIMMSKTKQEIKKLVAGYVAYASDHLKLQAKPPIIGLTYNGIPFLGYKIYRERIVMNGKGKRRFCKNIGMLGKLFSRSAISEREYADRLVAVLAYPAFADSRQYRRRVLGLMS